MRMLGSVCNVAFLSKKDLQTPEYQTAYTVDSRYYVDRFRFIGYYVGNSKTKPLCKLFPLLRCPKMPNPGITL